MSDGNGKRRFPGLPERIAGLEELAFNLWWSWHPEARNLFKMLHRTAWKESVHNPVLELHELGPAVFAQAVKDERFLRHYDAVMSRFHGDIGSAGWFHNAVAEPDAFTIAFFSAEYGLQHSLPFYAGGLGFLAGDILKECSNLRVPLVGVGFMYPQGYLRQRMAADGTQISQSQPLEREKAPIERVGGADGNPLLVRVPAGEPPIFVEVWRVQVGNVPLYLMDTDVEPNSMEDRGISSHLYVGDPEGRLRQEMVLGIGGVEVLNALDIHCSVLHLNEGHPAFAVLERVREMVKDGAAPAQAFELVRQATIFTTHTPVPAGHDVFDFALMEKHFSSYRPHLGLSREEFLALGRNPERPEQGFNMTAFALRSAAHSNAVSKKHGEVTRRMWHSLWPDRREEDVPIGHVTNGVHVPTWIDPKMELLLNSHLWPNWLDDHDNPDTIRLVDDIPDRELWDTHNWLKMKLILNIMDRARRQWLEESPEPSCLLGAGLFLDPNVLTLGFARRFTTYKRAALILSDPERLKKLLNDRWKPVQVVFAGKAHPDDKPAQEILRKVFLAAKDPAFGGRIAFVEDYNEQFAQYLTHGVDVWLNNPQPPLEACGTSGMKAAINGVPHLSVRDGWWVEGYRGGNGWVFGSDGGERDDAADAASLYRTLEEEIVPLYYDTGSDGMPQGWVRVMKEAMKTAMPFFNARRMVKEYARRFYHPAMAACGVHVRQ
jgi:starch phosphorylase